MCGCMRVYSIVRVYKCVLHLPVCSCSVLLVYPTLAIFFFSSLLHCSQSDEDGDDQFFDAEESLASRSPG